MKKKIIIAILLLTAILLVVYFSVGFYYKDKFLSNVYVNGVNVSGKTLNEADKELAKTSSWDKIVVKSDTEEFANIKAEDIEYKYLGSPDLPKILNKQNEWNWPVHVFNDSSYKTPILSEYNEDKVREIIGGIDKLDKEPVNAKVKYSDETGNFVIEPHSHSIALKKQQLFDLVAEGINKRDSEVNIEKNIAQPSIMTDDESLVAARDKANKYLKMQLKYDFGDREEIIDNSLLKDWITVNDTEVNVDEGKVKEYVAELAKKYDTYGRGRPFKTSTGQEITTKGGTYGWMTHRGKTTSDLIKHIKAGENKTIKPIYSYKALIRDTNDIGNSYVEIDLKGQMVYVYVDGEQKIKTPTVTGNISKGYNTPAGVYPLNYKERDAVLRGENYASPVKYWMPFNGNIGLHDADWRNSFGGNIYQSNGSHGCVNLPPENTKTIFDLIYPGMPVVVH